MQDLPQQAPQQVIVQQVAPSKVLKELEIKMPEETKDTVLTDEVALNTAEQKKSEPYEKLPCSEEDRANVYQIITTLAENGKLALLFKQNELKELGSKIDHLHPLKFLSAIFTNADLKERAGQFFGDYFKKNAFMAEIGPGLTAEAEKGGLNAKNIEKFAKEVGVSAEKIRPFFESQNWEGLVEFLIHG